MGAGVNPQRLSLGGSGQPAFGTISGPEFAPARVVQMVSFDVAVTAESKEGSGGGFGIRVLGIEAGMKEDGSDVAGSTTRISFQLPLVLPQQDMSE